MRAAAAGETGAGAALQAIVRLGLGTGFDANFTMNRERRSNNHHQGPFHIQP